MKYIAALVCVLFFAILPQPPPSHAEAGGGKNDLCFSLKKDGRLCGARALFRNTAERDLLVSSFKTVSTMAPLPPLIRVNVVRNTQIKTIIIWVSDGTRLYAMSVGTSFEDALNKLMRVIRDKPPNKPFIIPYGKEKCFRKNPEMCA